MANISIDFSKLLPRALPHFLRKENTLAVVDSIAAVFNGLNSDLLTFRNSKRTEVSVTPQTTYLEYYLNVILGYDPILKGIFIEDTSGVRANYLRRKSEERPDYYLYRKSEGKPNRYWDRRIEADSSESYIIHVPASVTYDANEMRRQVEKYNLAGKTFTIVTP